MSRQALDRHHEPVRHKWIAFKEPWETRPAIYYLNVTMEEALKMHREDLREPAMPASDTKEAR